MLFSVISILMLQESFTIIMLKIKLKLKIKKDASEQTEDFFFSPCSFQLSEELTTFYISKLNIP